MSKDVPPDKISLRGRRLGRQQRGLSEDTQHKRGKDIMKD